MDLTRTQLQEITALFEDTAEFYCDDNLISGQKLWTVLECLATAKLAELNGEIVWTIYIHQLQWLCAQWLNVLYIIFKKIQ